MKLRKRNSKKPKFNKTKRYKLIATTSIIFHILGASWVLYKLIFDIENWIENMNSTRLFIGLDSHHHTQEIILKSWITAIQIRYIISDFYAFWNALNNCFLLSYTIKMHLIEGIICCLVFFIHKDCVVFGIVCFIWTILWLGSYYVLINQNI